MTHETLLMMHQNVWEPAGLVCSSIEPEPESMQYCAHTLNIDGRLMLFRTAKRTPTKLGQFVTLWKRSAQGPIRPFDTSDGVASFVIHAGLGTGLGQFVFPLEVLTRHDVVSVSGKGGKRAMRVYPPDVQGLSTTARRTQKWQCEYFLPLDSDVALIKELYSA
ncbi:MepB family protein [Arthrobacter antibioticus]|uniref:MepB family protein n=1 Tax=Arthrobacter sp. H35-MC1 TaxID=3046203 RepID=UPI0024B9F83C|nr:MepB family protein [Arthrobacter sp. H35-MC1]MDJ0316007.1 MepB family protein [Arthrobacter sp. H35-MC1]